MARLRRKGAGVAANAGMSCQTFCTDLQAKIDCFNCRLVTGTEEELGRGASVLGTAAAGGGGGKYETPAAACLMDVAADRFAADPAGLPGRVLAAAAAACL